MFEERVFISPNYNPEDYTRINLRMSSPRVDWEKAIDIFKDRIEGRYLKAIHVLLATMNGENADFSFSAMAIMCLLMETLHQFYNGRDKTRGGMNEDAFVEFLSMSRNFGRHFTTDEAKMFYQHIRCGILHQAQTKENTQLTRKSGVMVETIENGIRVDIRKCFEAILDDVHVYTMNLLDPMEEKLRRNFIRKMGYIVRGYRP